MTPSQTLYRLWWSLRYAQPLSLFSRRWGHQDEYLAWFNTAANPTLRKPAAQWQFCSRTPSMVGSQAFHFFGVERVLSDNRGWHWKPWGENWLHNLHAFDDFVADGATERFEWHAKLVTNWMVANAPGKGVGWHINSLSRRIVNWIKWDLDQNGLGEIGRRNLVVQARFLRQRLGASLTSPYPSKAGKALIFAGAFFEGGEADAWRRTGLSLLRNATKSSQLKSRLVRKQIDGKVLAEDLLDLLQLSRVYPGLLSADVLQYWQKLAVELLSHDASLRAGEAGQHAVTPIFFGEPSTRALLQYAQHLGLKA